MDSDMIELLGLRKAYGDQQVLDGIDLGVRRGTVFALLGPNGAGKTTLIRILTTLAAPDGGTATVAGHDVHRDPGRVRRTLTLTGQDTAVDELLTGGENLVLMGRLFGLGRRGARARARDLLAEVELTDSADRLVRTYSGGMRRRLDLAIGVIPRPPVIFLDEPTTGLDPASRRRVWQSIRALAAAGTTIFLTTQYLEEADELADRVAILDGGRLIAEGSPGELKRYVGAELVHLTFPVADSARDAAKRLGEHGVDARLAATGPALTVRTGGGAAEIAVLLGHLGDLAADARLSVTAPSLDDAFLALTGHAAHAPSGADLRAGDSPNRTAGHHGKDAA